MSCKLIAMVLVLLAMTCADAVSLHQSCSTDRDCIGADTYCYQSGKCVSCTHCNLYNRFPGTACAKDKNQCGQCLPGMEAEHNLDGTFSCHPSGTLPPSTQTPGLGAPNTFFTVPIIVSISIVLLILVGTCVYLLCKYNNTCVVIRNIISNNNLMNTGDCSKCPDSNLQSQQSKPPPYSESNPTAPPFEDPPASPDPPIYQTVYHLAENDPNQTANAFIAPSSYVTGGNLGSNPDPDDPEEEFEAAEDDALINNTSISHPDDEETQPSTWTPTPDSEAGSAIGPTNFTGLNFEQLRISQPDVSLIVQQGPSSRSNSHPSIQFTSQSQTGNADNSSDRNTQQINIITHVGPVYINPTVSK